VWGRTKKRDSWGLKKYLGRPKDDWIVRQNESLRIISEELWQKVHVQIDTTRRAYRNEREGQPAGRPASGTESKYLLSGFIECGVCGGGMYVWSRDFKQFRRHLYVCGYNHERGRSICPNGLPIPMDAADAAVLNAIQDDLLRPEVLDLALSEALEMLKPSAMMNTDRRAELKTELAKVEAEARSYAEASRGRSTASWLH
jgi:hypothetical protein